MEDLALRVLEAVAAAAPSAALRSDALAASLGVENQAVVAAVNSLVTRNVGRARREERRGERGEEGASNEPNE